MEKMKVEDLTNEDLLEEFEYAVKRNHYDPIDSRMPLFTEDEMRDELRNRLKKKD